MNTQQEQNEIINEHKLKVQQACTVKTRHPSIEFYQSGQDRNDKYALTHTYAMYNGDIWPMCGYGWNRSNGENFSIFRNQPGTEGKCKLCQRNLRTGKLPLVNGFPHKTKWL